MALPLPTLLAVLRALDEETRLRIVALLRHGELTVTDITDILGSSQPGISRHLRLLSDAGVVEKHREGTWMFFDLVSSGPIGQLLDEVLGAIDPHDSVMAADLDRLAIVRGRRGAAAQEYFARIASRWDEERSLHAPDETVEEAILDVIGNGPLGAVLDVGTGTGRILQVVGPRASRAVGLDNSHSMLAVARANLERAEIRGIELRQGDVYSPPFAAASFDLVVIHQVLHFLDDPARATREAARLLKPGGKLVIVDFAPHSLEFLRTDHAHLRLGFRADTVAGWLEHASLEVATIRTIDPPTAGAGERLTVTLWVAHDRRPSLTHPLPSSPADEVLS
ncbi:MAG: ArsR/SmtB family transcription factor [Ilumatobacteraceae bacterium]